MSQSNQLTPVEQVFEQIYKRVLEEGPWPDILSLNDMLERSITEAQARHSFMRGVTDVQFLGYMSRRQAAANTRAAAARRIPNLTEQDFWDAAFEYDPLGPDQPAVSRLKRIVESGQLQQVTLGKIYGNTTLKLCPCEGALPTTESHSFTPPFGYAVTDCGAISYPDAHPSEEMAPPDLKKLSLSSKPESTDLPTLKDNQDDALRRFASLGYVFQEDRSLQGTWVKTGHVLVIDMGDKPVRQRHPWFVLASTWPTDHGETAQEGDFYYHAKETVWRDASTEPGVLPGDYNRTPVCRIDPIIDDDMRPVIRQFGPNFQFKPLRLGGRRKSILNTLYGPSLAHAKRQVCYTKAGLEYMRYNPRTKEYSFPDLSKMSFEGEQGFFGALEAQATIDIRTEPIPVQQHILPPSIGIPHGFEHRRLASSSPGF